MLSQIKSWLDEVRRKMTQQKIPAELVNDFKVFREIKNIDRIQIVAWIYFIQSFLYHFRWYVEGANLLEAFAPDFSSFGDFCLYVGLLNFPFALYISFRKSWIVKSRARRRNVIGIMAVLSFFFLVWPIISDDFKNAGYLKFIVYVFSVSWMFSLAPKQLFYFLCFCIIGLVIGRTLYIDATAFNWDWNFNHFWKSAYNISFYIAIVVYIINTYNYYQNVTIFLNQVQIKAEQERIKHLEDLRARFYTNLTHEFRTPLTMIIGMSKEIMDDPKRWAFEGAKSIQLHSHGLLRLITQILDLSKIESGSLTLHPVNGNVIPFLGYIIDSFSGPSSAKNIVIHYLYEEEEILMDFDPDKLKTIISNLLSNAIKFSPDVSHIYVSVNQHQSDNQNQLEITVRDQGIGISKEEIEHIFDRFYQVKNEYSLAGMGTGVGLSLVKELIELFHGTIHVTSQPGKGTQFRLTFPINQLSLELVKNDQMLNLVTEENFSLLPDFDHQNIKNGNGGSQELLIIEDNPDVSEYIGICLQDIYQLSFCKNGTEGVELAIQNVPDLIISDIMMPGKDGFALAKELKQNPVASHIPIILLTAKSDIASKIAGLESGVDAYMTKPFDKEELRAQVQNLLIKYKEFHARYADPEVILSSSQNESLEVEDEFITRIRTLVHQHLDDNDFSVRDLERGLFLSRSQLHKKLKALTGLSAMQFVSRIRFSVAREKLKLNKESISEIAYQVGFSDPNYFSRTYTEAYGETPSETRNRFIK